MDNEQKFDYDFILEIFKACLTDKSFLEIVVGHCKQSYFPEGVLEIVFKEIKDQYRLEGKKPTVGTLKLSLRKNRQALEVLEEVKDMESVDVGHTMFHIEEFIKHNRFIELYNRAADDFSKGDTKKAYSSFQKGAEEISGFSLTSDMFEKVFGDFSKRQNERLGKKTETTRIPSGIDELDRRTTFETGELAIWMAESKGGKSFLLTHLGLTAARLGHGVAHFQIEGKKAQCLNRYDAAWSGSLYQDVKDGEFSDKKYAAHKKILENLGKSDVHVIAAEKFNSMNMLEIRKKLIELKKKYDIKVVIIDYLDLVNPDDQFYKPSEERFRQQKTAQAMKELAMELNVIVHTATQTSDIDVELKNDPDFVIRRSNLAEDRGKVRPADRLLSLNRTEDEEENNLLRIFIDADREHKRQRPIKIATNLKYSRFYDRKRTLSNIFDEEMAD